MEKSSSLQKPTSEQKVTEVKDANASKTEKQKEKDSTEKASKKKNDTVGKSQASQIKVK